MFLDVQPLEWLCQYSGQTLESLYGCIGELTPFRVVILKADLLGAMVKCRPDFFRCMKWTQVGCSLFLSQVANSSQKYIPEVRALCQLAPVLSSPYINIWYLRGKNIEIAPQTFICLYDLTKAKFSTLLGWGSAGNFWILWDFGPVPPFPCDYAKFKAREFLPSLLGPYPSSSKSLKT